jgi:hypothetical protein
MVLFQQLQGRPADYTGINTVNLQQQVKKGRSTAHHPVGSTKAFGARGFFQPAKQGFYPSVKAYTNLISLAQHAGAVVLPQQFLGFLQISPHD